jgi:hypothetical protein
MEIEYEGLVKKRNNTHSFFTNSCFYKWESYLKEHKVEPIKRIATELRKREDKHITSKKHTRYGWFVSLGSIPQRTYVPVEEFTKDGYLSTLSLSLTVTKTDECSSSLSMER